jgi:uncharacterized protein YdeI (YjbR/CyaY-like superfamily)
LGSPEAKPVKITVVPTGVAARKTGASERKTEPPPRKSAPPSRRIAAASKRVAGSEPASAKTRATAAKPAAARKRIPAAAQAIAVPKELQALLRTNADARATWESLTASHRREYVTWIEDAKKIETRARRLEETIAMLVEGER